MVTPRGVSSARYAATKSGDVGDSGNPSVVGPGREPGSGLVAGSESVV